MSVLIYRDAQTAGMCAATLLAGHLLRDPKCVIGVDYHETLVPAYEMLKSMTDNGLLNWSETRIYQLFEFLADESGEQRIANLLGKVLFSHTDITVSQYAVPFATEADGTSAAEAFEQRILNDGGLDACLLAVRQDGSLLMNRSASEHPYTHVVSGDGNGFITVGLTAVMQAKHPIVVAIGKESAEAVKSMLSGSISESPLSALKLNPKATFILDEEAASLL